MPCPEPGANLLPRPPGIQPWRIEPLTPESRASAATDAPNGTEASDATLALIVETLDAEKAEDIVEIDLHGKSAVADHMVICSGRSTRQVTALAEKLADKLKDSLGRTARTEGKTQGDWVLLDAGDVVVHIFRPEVREFYQLEKMWQGTAPEAAARHS